MPQSIRIPPEVAVEIRKAAHEEDRSITQMIIVLLKRAMRMVVK